MSEIREKSKQTLLQHYGVDSPLKSEIIKAQSRQTCFEKYGCEYSIQSEDVKEKCRQTCVKKYGVEYPLQSKEIREKVEQSMIDRYGVEHALQSTELVEKSKKTCLYNFGVEYGIQTPQCKIKCNCAEALQKRHKTMKKNGSYGKSKVEDKLYEYLCDRFGVEDVERQKLVDRWNIDIYIKSLNTYIQLDGVYWHGLDRPIDLIKEFRTPRDKVIYRTSMTDKEQNSYFEAHQLKLIRITDIEFKRGISEVQRSDFGFSSQMGKLK